MTTYVYTDGSALNNADKNKRKAGCAFLIRQDDKDIFLSGYYLEDATNNVAELTAIYSAYCYMRHHMNEYYKNICFKADSNYSIKIFTKQNTPKMNKELIDKIFALEQKFIDNGFEIRYEHVKAHTNGTDTDSAANSIVDETAKKCAKTGKRIKKTFD